MNATAPQIDLNIGKLCIYMAEKPDTYICSNCGGEFNFGWSDEEAHAEAERDFGRDGHALDMAIVCDDCYQRMRERAGEQWGNE